MITIRHGDMFSDDADALVNPVNCVGVMGKGLALQFKNRYPAAFRAYASSCAHRRLRPGGLLLHPEEGRFVVCFATKEHWRQPSRLEWIDTGLALLADELQGPYRDLIHSIAVPALGAGLGGLPWQHVQPLIHKHLDGVNADVRVYAPHETSGPWGGKP